jgi:hypothetical protein
MMESRFSKGKSTTSSVLHGRRYLEECGKGRDVLSGPGAEEEWRNCGGKLLCATRFYDVNTDHHQERNGPWTSCIVKHNWNYRNCDSSSIQNLLNVSTIVLKLR